MEHNEGVAGNQEPAARTPATRPGVRRRMPAADRRLVILAAAERAFGQGSFHEVPLDEVAEGAGVSKALIYEHFESKRDLYRALLTSATDDLMLRVSSAVAGQPAREGRLQAGIEAFVDFVSVRPGAARLLFHGAADPDVANELERLWAEAAAVIESLMAENLPASRADDPIPSQLASSMLAHQLIGALQALANWWETHRDATPEQVTRMAMEFNWLGLGRLADGERWRPSAAQEDGAEEG